MSEKSPLQKKKEEKEKKEPDTKTKLHHHATNALLGASNLVAHAQRKQKKQDMSKQQTDNSEPSSISERKRKTEASENKKIELFIESTIKTIMAVLVYASFGVDLMIFSEFYNKSNKMQGINPNKYPYVEENPTKGKDMAGGRFGKSQKKPNSFGESIDRRLLGYRDSWQWPWKNPATKEFIETSGEGWGLTKWIMYFATHVSMNVIAISRNIMYTTFKVSSRIWNPKSYLMNALYLFPAGYVIYNIIFKTLLMKGVWGSILTALFCILKSSIITKNWNVYTPPQDPEDDSFLMKAFNIFVKVMLIGFLWMVLSFFNTVYLTSAFAFMFIVTPFMGDILRGGNPNSKYNFRKRFVELMWKNKILISLVCMIMISIDAYKNLGKDPGYAFIGITVGLFIAYLRNIIGR